MPEAQVTTRNRDVYSCNLYIGIKIMMVGVATQEDCVEGEKQWFKNATKGKKSTCNF